MKNKSVHVKKKICHRSKFRDILCSLLNSFAQEFHVLILNGSHILKHGPIEKFIRFNLMYDLT